MSEYLNICEWVEAFDNNEFINPSRETQCKAGWYDWFCSDKVLAEKTKRLGGYLKRILKANEMSKRFDPEKCCVIFKNNCQMAGRLYDDFRICDIETGKVIYIIVPKYGFTSTPDLEKTRIWGKENNFKEPLFKTKTIGDLIKWFAVK